jgi:hypothetical protein
MGIKMIIFFGIFFSVLMVEGQEELILAGSVSLAKKEYAITHVAAAATKLLRLANGCEGMSDEEREKGRAFFYSFVAYCNNEYQKKKLHTLVTETSINETLKYYKLNKELAEAYILNRLVHSHYRYKLEIQFSDLRVDQPSTPMVLLKSGGLYQCNESFFEAVVAYMSSFGNVSDGGSQLIKDLRNSRPKNQCVCYFNAFSLSSERQQLEVKNRRRINADILKSMIHALYFKQEQELFLKGLCQQWDFDFSVLIADKLCSIGTNKTSF